MRDKSTKYLIFDVNGRVVLDKIVSTDSDLAIDVRSFNSGIYFLKVISNGKEEHIKFIIR